MNYTAEQQKAVDNFKARLKAAQENMKRRAEERKVKCEHPDLDLLHPASEQPGAQG